MDDIKLPPLPEPHWPRGYHGHVPSGGYTKDQMHQYARAALAAAPAPAPLTDERVRDAYMSTNTRTHDQTFAAFRDGVRFAERAHGIGTDAAPAPRPDTADAMNEPKNGKDWHVVWWNESARLMLPADSKLDSFQAYKNGTLMFTIKRAARAQAQKGE